MTFTSATGMLYSGARVLENGILQKETFNTCGIFDDTAKTVLLALIFHYFLCYHRVRFNL